ncbi:MAG: glycosyltransferase family 2 protein [Ruminococcus sp.]|nr:glycosyltransferase family 2 protein [Ruminococcus sp.]
MISIVVPVYNVEKYLNQCVDSILMQTYKDFEIILVDDGSTDSSGKICDEYAEENGNIKVIHKQNEGLGLARNTGIEQTNGDYVTFLDSDDYWGSEKALSALMDSIEKNNADTCIGGYTRVTNDGKVILSEAPDNYIYEGDMVKNGFFPRLMGSSPEIKDSFRPSVWNAVYSMDIIKKEKILFPSEREYIAEDIVFDIDYYKYSERVCLVNSSDYYYRVTPGSLTQSYKPDRFEKVVFLYKEVFKRLKEKGYDNSCVLRAKRQFFVYLRACISQENTDVSKKPKNEAIKRIKTICNEEFTQNCINTYPVKKLGIAQKTFLFFVKNAMARTLYLLVCNSKKKGGKA